MDTARELAGDRTDLPPVVPLFPLPRHVFLPGLPYPYRVFEPRYLALVDHLLARPASHRWLSIPLLRPGDPSFDGGGPAFARVATLGRVTGWRRQPNGHLHIVVLGEERVRLTEVASDHPFRLASTERWPDVAAAPAADDLATRVSALKQLLASLVVYLGPRGRPLAELAPGWDDPHRLPYRLAAALLEDPASAQAVLETRSLAGRLDLVEDALAGALAAADEGSSGRCAFPRS